MRVSDYLLGKLNLELRHRATLLLCLALRSLKLLQLYLQGVKIHYVEKGDRSKPLMLFIHGFPEFWYSWRHQLKEFSKDFW